MIFTRKPYIDGAKVIDDGKYISRECTWGMGFFTSFAIAWCGFFGLRCKKYEHKIQRAKKRVLNQLIEAGETHGFNALVGVDLQVHGLTVFGQCQGIIIEDNK